MKPKKTLSKYLYRGSVLFVYILGILVAVVMCLIAIFVFLKAPTLLAKGIGILLSLLLVALVIIMLGLIGVIDVD